MKFTIPLEPTGQMRARHGVVNGHARTYKHAKQLANENKLLTLALPYRPEAPFDTALDVSIVAYMPIPRSMAKFRAEMARTGEIRPTGKPDSDNIAKNVLDAFNGVFWKDDKSIVGLVVRKYYSDEPRYEIEIKEAI